MTDSRAARIAAAAERIRQKNEEFRREHGGDRASGRSRERTRER